MGDSNIFFYYLHCGKKVIKNGKVIEVEILTPIKVLVTIFVH